MSSRGHLGPGTRRAVAASLCVLVAVAAVVPYLVWWAALPDPMASHWTASGVPNGSMGRGGTALLLAGIPVVLGVLGGALALWARGAFTRLAALAVAMGGLFVAIDWVTVLANVHAGHWQDAARLGLLASLGVAAAGLAVGVALASAVWRLLKVPTTSPRRVRPVGSRPPTVGLQPHEHAVWISQAHGSWGWIPPAGGALLGTVLVTVTGSVAACLLAVVAGVLLSSVASVHVVVDGTSMRIRFGWLPVPVISVPVGKMAKVEAIDVRPADWGGWGYRGSRKMLGRAAVVVRAGPGIRLDLTDGSTLAVTVDDAERGAALLNDLLARTGPPPSG